MRLEQQRKEQEILNDDIQKQNAAKYIYNTIQYFFTVQKNKKKKTKKKT